MYCSSRKGFALLESLHVGLTGIDTRDHPLLCDQKYLKPHCRCGRCSPAAAQRERLFGNSYVLNPVGDFRVALLDFGAKDDILPPSRAARCDGRSSAVELRYQCNRFDGLMGRGTHDSDTYHVARMAEPYLVMGHGIALHLGAIDTIWHGHCAGRVGSSIMLNVA
jgi:hypothetical protein